MNKRFNSASLAIAAALLSGSAGAGLAQSSWTAGDVGPVATSGSSFYDSAANSFSLVSSGNGIWGTIDAFEFLSQDVTGDVQITARLASQQEDDPWAKAGVMLRQSADPGAPFAFGFATPANGINFQTRGSQADGAGSGLPNFQLLGAGAAPNWLRLIRSGNYVVGYRSEDGLTWDHPTAEQILLNGPFMAGLAASSRKDPSLPANPLADYHFDDATGTIASDSSGNSKNGALFGGAAWGNGKIKGALSLNGASGSYASLPSALVSGTGSYTLAAWVKWNGGNNWQRIFDFGSGTGVYMFLTPKSGNGTCRFAIKSSASGNAEQVIDAPVLPVGVWKHVAVTISSGTGGSIGTLYIDGLQVGQNTAMTATPSSMGATSQNWLGRSQYANDPCFSGQVDELKIFNRVLSPGEIASLVANTQVAYYRFIETSGTTAADSSGNGQTATLAGNASWQSNALGLGSANGSGGGSNGYATLPNGIVSGVGDFTASAWIKWYGGNMWQRVFDFGSGTGSYMYLTPKSGVNTLRFGMKCAATGNVEQFVEGPAIASGVWKHVAISKQGKVATLYVDGLQVGQNANMASLPSDLGVSTQNWIGRSQFSADPYFNGLICEVRLYSRAMSSGEIAALGSGGSPAAPVRFAPPVYSATGGTLSLGGAVFDNVVVSSTLQASFGPLPTPWVAENIGDTSGASVGYDPAGGTFLLTGSGGALAASGSDSFTFLHRTWYGDGEFVVRVADLPNASGPAQVGLVLRDGATPLSPTAASASLVLNASGEAVFSVRTAASGSSATIGVADLAAPAWLKLKRSGTVLSGYASYDGAAWTLVGSVPQAGSQSPGGSTAPSEIGLALASSSSKPSTTAIFDHLSLSGPDGNANGLLDAFEMAFFGNLKQSAEADPDQDGLTNAQEQALGTNPLVADTGVSSNGVPQIPVSLVPQSKPGTLERDVWTNIPGFNVSDLTSSAAFAGAPNAVDYVSSAASPVNYADNFGQRLRGTVTAPVTGDYTFWISADDTAELWLGANASRFTKRKIASLGVAVPVQTWDRYPSQKSVTVSLQAGQQYWIEALAKENVGGDHVEVAWQYPGQTRQIIPGQYLASPAIDTNDINDDSLPDDWAADHNVTGGEYGQASNGGQTNFQYYYYTTNPQGVLEHCVWYNLPGYHVEDLTRTPAFAGAPNLREYLPSAASPVNVADNFGQRLRGLVTAPVSGDYTFWVAADDTAELWLGANASRFSKKRIAWLGASVSPLVWDAYPSQKSLTVSLQAGQQYWIEALSKENGGHDHVEIAWQYPGQSRQVIPGQYLSAPGIDPNDLDDDNLPDDWQAANHLDRLSGGEYGDPDRDGMTNFEEYLFGSNPNVWGGVQGCLTRDVWTGLKGANVSDLTLSPGFLQKTPHELLQGASFNPSSGVLDNYGQRLRGTVTAPATGYYTFWIAGDDGTELWLSSDSHKFQKKRIAHSDTYQAYGAFDNLPSQMSQPILLQAGQSYYIEILHKESVGVDHVEVAWQKPGGSREIIPSQYLTSYAQDLDDQDDDSMPDSWESQFGLDPADNGRKDPKQASYADYDNDGLANRVEYLLGTNPCLADSDGDGFSDYDEFYVYGSDPVKNDIGQFTVSQSIPGAAYAELSGTWNFTSEGYAQCVDMRGSIDYTLEVPSEGLWGLEVLAKQYGWSEDVAIPVELILDGISLGKFQFAATQDVPAKVRLVTPYLTQGSHTLRVVNDNYLAFRSLEIQSVNLLRPEGLDADGDGSPDWISAKIDKEYSLDPLPARTYTSPLCVEGNGRFADQGGMLSGSIFADLKAGIGNRWYADAALDPAGTSTSLTVMLPGAGIVRTGTVEWAALNLVEAANSTMVVRKGDSFRFTAFPMGGAMEGTVNLVVTSGSTAIANASFTADSPCVYRFDQAGSYTVSSTGTGNSGSIRIEVREADFGDPVIGYVNNNRDWPLPNVKTDVALDWDGSLAVIKESALSGGGRQFTLTPTAEGECRVLARIYPGGPILARGTIQCAYFHGTDDTHSGYVIEKGDDGTEVINANYVADLIPPGGYMKIAIFVGGVTFEDGTTIKILRASDFSAYGVASVHFIYPAGTTTSFCHHLYIYDAQNRQVGYIP